MKKILLSLVTILTCAGIIAKQKGLPPDATGMRNLTAAELTTAMTPGWNSGNSLEARPLETSWGNPVLSQQLFDSVKAAGFNSVRIPVAWSSHFSDATNYIIDPTFLSHVGDIVNYALKSGLYAIINIHWDGGWMQPTNALKTSVNNRLDIMWTQIANHFIDFGDSLLFAGTNEVMKDGDYGTPTAEYYTVQNSFNQTFVNAVRATGGKNAYRFLVVQGFNTNIGHTINFFQMPDDAATDKLLVEVHYYDPYNFTINNGNHNVIQWGKYVTEPSKTETWANESYADAQFQLMKTNFFDKGIAVILGEYCATRRTDLGSVKLNKEHAFFRLYYHHYITKSIIAHKLIPFYWDNGYNGNDASGVFNRSNGQKADPENIKALTDTSFKMPAFPVVDINTSIINDFEIFPNPVKDILNITSDELSEDKTVKIINIAGVTVKTMKMSGKQLNVANLPSGFYLINLDDKETGSFIKE